MTGATKANSTIATPPFARPKTAIYLRIAVNIGQQLGCEEDWNGSFLKADAALTKCTVLPFHFTEATAYQIGLITGIA
jgi:hypothetical protein